MEAPRHGERMEDSGQTSRALSTLFPRSRYVSERGRSGPKWPDVATRAGARLWTAGPLAGSPLLDLGLAAGFGEFLGDRLGVGLGNAFLHRLGRGIDQILGFLEPQSGHFAHGLDDVHLVVADGGEDHGELGLLLGGRRGSPPPRPGRRPGGGRPGGPATNPPP